MTLEVRAINDTLDRCTKEYVKATKKLIDETQFYNSEISDAEIEKVMKLRDVNVEIIQSGTVSAGKEILKKTKKRTAILNFADAIRPGGWVLNGAPTQEENICRCSNLYPALLGKEAFKNYYYVNSVYMYPKTEDELYGADIEVPAGVTWEDLNPLHAVYTNRLMYFKDVTFFKNDSTYELEDAYNLDVITCPAPAVQWKDEDVAYYVFRERAKQIIKSAILNKVDNLILGAWGCGAFGQDPEIVCKAFLSVIKEYPAFDNVIFAIRCTSEYWKDDNYKAFAKVLNIQGD